MKAIVFLLLLDFSGSMDQLLDGKSKESQLRAETYALLSTAGKGDEALALVFGTQPKKACRDLLPLTGTAGSIAQAIERLRPGNQGRTPLALGIERTIQLALQRQVQNVVVVTDGGDSCGQDPCAALVAGDQQMEKAKAKINLHLIGFDLNTSDSKLECLKNLKLKNIKLSISEAGDSAALQASLKRSQMSGLTETPLALSAREAQIKGLQRTKTSSSIASEDSEGSRANGKSNLATDKNSARLEILGAPAQAKFTLTSQSFNQDWLGSYIVVAPPGEYRVRWIDDNGSELSLNLPASTHTKLPWARLMKQATAPLTLTGSSLAFHWRPSEKTLQIHGPIAEKDTLASFEPNPLKMSDMQFGEWEIETTSPPWLKSLEKKKVEIGLRPTDLEIEKLFATELVWIDNPEPDQPGVMSLQTSKAAPERYFIPAGTERVPVPKSAKVVWLRP